jgi:hypothetical protein
MAEGEREMSNCELFDLKYCRQLSERDKEIAALKKQLEDRECCGNCKHIACDEQTGELSCENDHCVDCKVYVGR